MSAALRASQQALLDHLSRQMCQTLFQGACPWRPRSVRSIQLGVQSFHWLIVCIYLHKPDLLLGTPRHNEHAHLSSCFGFVHLLACTRQGARRVVTCGLAASLLAAASTAGLPCWRGRLLFNNGWGMARPAAVSWILSVHTAWIEAEHPAAELASHPAINFVQESRVPLSDVLINCHAFAVLDGY